MHGLPRARDHPLLLWPKNSGLPESEHPPLRPTLLTQQPADHINSPERGVGAVHRRRLEAPHLTIGRRAIRIFVRPETRTATALLRLLRLDRVDAREVEPTLLPLLRRTAAEGHVARSNSNKKTRCSTKRPLHATRPQKMQINVRVDCTVLPLCCASLSRLVRRCRGAQGRQPRRQPISPLGLLAL